MFQLDCSQVGTTLQGSWGRLRTSRFKSKSLTAQSLPFGRFHYREVIGSILPPVLWALVRSVCSGAVLLQALRVRTVWEWEVVPWSLQRAKVWVYGSVSSVRSWLGLGLNLLYVKWGLGNRTTPSLACQSSINQHFIWRAHIHESQFVW